MSESRPQTEAGRRLLARWRAGPYSDLAGLVAELEAEAAQRALADVRRAVEVGRLGAAIHEVFCHRNARMHSAPDHSAAQVLALLDTPPEGVSEP